MVQKIAVTLDRKTVADLDRWVREGKYPNRSRALQSAVDLLGERDRRTRLALARELAKLDPKEEKQLAEEGFGDKWPGYSRQGRQGAKNAIGRRWFFSQTLTVAAQPQPTNYADLPDSP